MVSVKEDKVASCLRHRSSFIRHRRIGSIHFADLKIQRPFETTFWASKYSSDVCTAFKLFSTNSASATDAYMNMQKDMLVFLGLDWQDVSPPRSEVCTNLLAKPNL